ncbi:hypothetical protein V1478_001096 [Vespula squamosa]|uniref:Uncharacterized protein n=1 Tax=Vespula squamosa TaxID=30214 RepID=A0ABD2C7D9_VESSQ
MWYSCGVKSARIDKEITHAPVPESTSTSVVPTPGTAATSVTAIATATALGSFCFATGGVEIKNSTGRDAKEKKKK